jgi:Protein of unknown function (DUF2283)
MVKANFRFEVSFSEKTGEPVAAYLRVRDGEVKETKEVVEGVAFADYGEEGFLLGVEFLSPCEVGVLDRLAEKEPEPIRGFLRHGVRQRMLVS